MKIFRKTGLLIATIGVMCGLGACNNDDNPESPYVKSKNNTTVLLYAIGSNNLEYNLYSDRSEILEAASKVDLENNSLYLYQVDNSYEPALYKLIQNRNGEYEFESVKSYDSDISSAEGSRINEVINDVAEICPSENYGLILWSHGTGIDYYPDNDLTTRSVVEDEIMSNRPMEYTFGYDKNPITGVITQINIDKLADAIPDNFFDFIWFDACYMSGIETIYEMRDKCNYFIAYPTEVFEWGMPYDLVMPYLLTSNYNLTSAAKAFFNYYADHSNSSARVATVAIVNMEEIENVADLAFEAVKRNGEINTGKLQKYTRRSVGPYYDFNGYILQVSDADNDPDFRIRWQSALDKFTVYKASTDVDFNYNKIDLDQFSGISTYIYNETSVGDFVEFYRRLDWYNRIYQ